MKEKWGGQSRATVSMRRTKRKKGEENLVALSLSGEQKGKENIKRNDEKREHKEE